MTAGTVDLDRSVAIERLRDVMDPCSVGSGNPMNIVEMGLVKEVSIVAGTLTVAMCLTSPQCLMLEHFAVEARRVLADLPDVDDVRVVGDSGMDWSSSRIEPAARARREERLSRLLPVLEVQGAGR